MGPVNHSDNAETPPTEPRSSMNERLSEENPSFSLLVFLR